MSGQSLAEVMKELAGQAETAARPSDYILGVVESSNPLSIRVSQKDLITAEYLITTDAVRDYDVDIEVNHTTENRAGGGGYAEFASHNHDYTGRKKIRVYNGLKPGEVVAMIRQRGGQQYLVVSRVHNHQGLSGQWGG
uniref:DUF2577 domain-containing protein n=1 Tax=Dialister sp. TaxID=1955814 RepID=UPI004025FDD5